MRLLSFGLIITSMAFLCSGCKQASVEGDAHSNTTANVAVLLDLQGEQGSLGQPAMNGFLLALQEQSPNSNSHIFSALLDTASDPEVTVKAAQFAASKASLASGYTNNDSLISTGSTFQESRVPFLAIGVTDPSLPNIIGDTIFLTAFGDNAQAAAAAEFAKDKFGDTVAILWSSKSEYTEMLPRYFRQRFEDLGGSVLLDISFEEGCDLSEAGKQVVNLTTKPAFIYLAGLPDCIGDAIHSLRSTGVDLPIVGGDGFDTPNLLRSGDVTTDNVWYTAHAWLSKETGTPKAKKFVKRYEETYGSSPEDSFAALGYDAAKLILHTLQRSQNLTADQLIRTLENTRGFEGVTGTINYDATHHVPIKTVWIIQVDDGERFLADSFIPQKVPAVMTPYKDGSNSQ